MTLVAEFQIHHSAVLAPDGTVLGDLPSFATSADTLVDLYRAMVLTRAFDARAVTLQRTGRLGTYASSLGQEAVGVGIAHGMAPDDILLPSFREHGAQLLRGVTMEELFAYWGGDERGSDFAGPRHDFPISVTVGGHAPHAAGVGLAIKLKGEARAAVCVFGDGATSKGDVYEAMNAAGVWQLPVVFVAINNGWAISTRREHQSAAQTLAQKAIAAGFTGEQVDGNDVIAVGAAVARACAQARDHGEPHMIECLTYRLGDHTTADDASRYREDSEVKRWWQQDPIARLRLYLTARHGWDQAREARLLEESNAQVAQAEERYLAMATQPPESMFEHLYGNRPAEIERQQQHLLEKLAAESSADG